MTKRSPDPALLAQQFKSEPTLERFLQIRWGNPDIEFDMSFLGGIDHAFALKDFLPSYGIPIELYVSILDADEASIRKMSILIMEDMFEEQLLKDEGETHIAARKLVMPQHLRDWLTCCMIGAMSWNDERQICTDLIALLHFRLTAGASRMEEMVDVHTKKHQARFAGGSLKAQGRTVSYRAVAQMMNVQASTVQRWFNSDAEFQEEADRLSGIFDSGGNLKPLKDI